MRRIKFTVDAALLRELGERLVGQPHIALAELIKNSYDADANLVEVAFDEDSITVVDDGHGMDAATFEGYWMRIGSPHKADSRVSPRLKRPLTGSKGVGRLAAQFLADRLDLATRAPNSKTVLSAAVDWEDAVRADELTEASAVIEDDAPSERFAGGSKTGTRLKLSGLHQAWDSDSLRGLAQQLWPLQPPFGVSTPDASGGFRIALRTDDPEAQIDFEAQMSAVLRLWDARIVGDIADPSEPDTDRSRRATSDEEEEEDPDLRHVEVTVRFNDGSSESLDIDLSLRHLHAVSFDIRIYSLANRQKFGIAVDEARNYIRRFGGIHIYDADFHLPYYGADNDWLGIEQDHARRITLSEMLPEELQVPGGLEYLPTNSRIYGVVRINTGTERDLAKEQGFPLREALSIQVSRDRLIDNSAYRELRTLVRTAMDFYATRAAKRANARIESIGPAGDLLTNRARSVEEAVESVKEELPEPSYQRLRDAVRDVGEAAESEAQQVARQSGLLGALATAGMAAVAYEHEAARELRELDRLRRRLARDVPEAADLAAELGEWIRRARATRALFLPLLDEENREEVRELRAQAVLQQVAKQTRVLLRSVTCDLTGVDERLKLPPGRFAEWSALFQNVFVNAANAMLDADVRVLKAISRSDRRSAAVIIMDTGSGIDLERASRYFRPFERGQVISAERRGLGVGGTGLGLTIVRMIANNLKCSARFIEPSEDDFATAFELSWRAA